MPKELPKRVSKLASHWTFRSVVVGIGLTLATAAIYLSWASQPLRRAKIGEVVRASEQSSVSVNGRQVKLGDELTTGQLLTTSPNSKVVLQQAEQIIARLGGASSATLENECIQLNEGQMIISSTDGCLGAIVLQSITEKGSVYIIERLGTVGQIKVLAGQINVALPSNRAIQPIALAQNQKITLSLTGDDVGPVRLMLPSEVNNLVQGELFQGFQKPLTNQNLIAGLSEKTPPQKPTPPAPQKPAPTPPVKPAVVAPPIAGAPAPEKPVHSAPAPKHTIQYENWENDGTEEKPASYQNTPSRSLRRRRAYEPSSEQFTYRRKRTRSPYVTSSYRRKTPSYSPPSYSPPAYSQPERAQPVPEVPKPVEVPPPMVELPSEVPPMEPPPVLEPIPPPVLVEPPLEEHP